MNIFRRCFSTKKPFGGKIQYISDIHFDRNKFKNFSFKKDPQAKCLIIAGDLGNPFCSKFINFLNDQCQKFPHVIFVPGNHEYYRNQSYNQSEIPKKYQNHTGNYQLVQEQLAQLEQNMDNLNILIKNKVILKSLNLTILGCTLWSHIPMPHHGIFQKQFSDFKKIYFNQTLITPQIINQIHQEEVTWLSQEIIKHQKNNHNENQSDLLIVTHHAPLIHGTCDPRFIPINPKNGYLDRCKYKNYSFNCLDLI